MGLAILGFCAVLVEAWNQNTSWEWLKLGYNPVSDIYKQYNDLKKKFPSL